MCRIKVKKLGIKAFTKEIVPTYVKDQENRAKNACRKIIDALSGKVTVINYETYVILDPLETPGRNSIITKTPRKLIMNKNLR